jgi:hypothetical protein
MDWDTLAGVTAVVILLYLALGPDELELFEDEGPRAPGD